MTIRDIVVGKHKGLKRYTVHVGDKVGIDKGDIGKKLASYVFKSAQIKVT